MADTTRPRAATSADVARESGFSRATVSYVLNDTPDKHISPATRELVLETAKRLGHVPNPLARALKTGRSNIVVCLIPALTLGFIFDNALDRLTESLADRGYALLISRVSGFNDNQAVAGLWGHITPRLVMTIGGTIPDEVEAMTQGLTSPVLNDSGIIPHHRIGRLQAEYLLDRGHRRLGYGMPADPLLRVYADQRLDGVAEACAAAGVEPPNVKIVEDHLESHEAAVDQWMRDGVTASCAHNDDVALLTLAAIRSRGLRTPDDLAVIGSDDIPLAQAELTTVGLDIDVTAALFVHDVLVALEETSVPRPDTDILRLVVRTSA